MLDDKKIFYIPPVAHDNRFVTYFSKKANLFNSFWQKAAQLLRITVFSPYQLIPLPISTWQALNS